MGCFVGPGLELPSDDAGEDTKPAELISKIKDLSVVNCPPVAMRLPLSESPRYKEKEPMPWVQHIPFP